MHREDLHVVGLPQDGILNENEGIVTGGSPASLGVEAEGGLVAVIVGGIESQLLGRSLAPLTFTLPNRMTVVDDKAILIPARSLRANTRNERRGQTIHQKGRIPVVAEGGGDPGSTAEGLASLGNGGIMGR